MFRAVSSRGVRQACAHTARALDVGARTRELVQCSLHWSAVAWRGEQSGARNEGRSAKPGPSRPQRGPQRPGQAPGPQRNGPQRKGKIPGPKNWARPDAPRQAAPKKEDKPAEKPKN